MQTKLYRKLRKAYDFCYYVKHIDIGHIKVSPKDTMPLSIHSRQPR